MEQHQDKGLIENRMFKSRLPDSAGFSMMFTPLIDVFFLLLIFIMLGTDVVYSKGIVIDPPSVDNAQYQHADKLVIALMADRDDQTYRNTQIYFNDRTVHDYNMLDNMLKESIGGAAFTPAAGSRFPVVMLRADHDVPSNDIAQVMSICRKNNVRLFITTKSR